MINKTLAVGLLHHFDDRLTGESRGQNDDRIADSRESKCGNDPIEVCESNERNRSRFSILRYYFNLVGNNSLLSRLTPLHM